MSPFFDDILRMFSLQFDSGCFSWEPQRVCEEFRYTIPARIQIFWYPHLHTKNKVKTQSQNTDRGQLPMMHCKFNISSSALLHQLQAISGLAWNTNTHVKQKPVQTWQACFLLFSHIYPPAKHKFHMLLNCSLHLGGDPTLRSRLRKVKLYQTQQNYRKRHQFPQWAARIPRWANGKVFFFLSVLEWNKPTFAFRR